MYINEQYRDLPLLQALPYRHIGRDGRCQTAEEPVLTEHLMDVYVNERLTMRLTCIPQHLTELTLGRLLTEGIIRSADDVAQIYICEQGLRARVLLTDACKVTRGSAISGEDVPANARAFTPAAPAPAEKPAAQADYVETTPTCCTDNRILDGSLLRFADLSPVKPIPWKASWIFALADRFAEGMPLHSQTFATHSCFLARGDELLFSCEDIGRHNALDKAIGYALRHSIDLSGCLVYSSGRIPTDMATKAIRAGIPLLAAKASPSREAIALAAQYGLTLVCAARRDRMKLFAGTPPEEEIPEARGI